MYSNKIAKKQEGKKKQNNTTTDNNLFLAQNIKSQCSYDTTILEYNDIPGITINMLCPGKSYSKMYGTEPRYNDLRYNDIPDITMSF